MDWSDITNTIGVLATIAGLSGVGAVVGLVLVGAFFPPRRKAKEVRREGDEY